MSAAAFTKTLLFSRYSFPPTVRNLRHLHFSSPFRRFSNASIPPSPMEITPPSDVSVAAGATGIAGGQESTLSVASSMERHFGEFIVQMEKSGNIHERIRSVASEIESTNRVMHAGLLLAHQTLPIPEVLKKADSQIGVLRNLYGRLAEILHECPGQYYRFHGDWRSETQTAVSLLCFSHWLETESLLTHAEAENKLGLNTSEFGLDIEDYLIGLCFMSNELELDLVKPSKSPSEQQNQFIPPPTEKAAPRVESLPQQPLARSKNLSLEYGGQFLSSTTRHVRIYAAYIDPITHAFDQTQMDKLTLILDPTNEFVCTPDTCQKVYASFQELVDHYEGAPLSEYTLRLIGSDIEHLIRKMLYDGEIKYNMNASVLNFSMGKPRVKFNSTQIQNVQ